MYFSIPAFLQLYVSLQYSIMTLQHVQIQNAETMHKTLTKQSRESIIFHNMALFHLHAKVLGFCGLLSVLYMDKNPS